MCLYIGASRAGLIINRQYIMAPENNPINDLLREMHATAAKFALFTGTSGNPMPNEIIGIVTESEVSKSAMRKAALK